MDTGLYFGLRFFEHLEGEPENTYNRDYCEDYIHSEYVNLNPYEDKILPFAIVIDDTSQQIVFSGIELKIVCGDTEIRIGTNPVDWIIEEADGKTYLFYLAEETVLPEEDLKKGKYFFRLSISVEGTRQEKFYSDVFILNRNIDAAEFPFYTITYEVVDETGGTLEGSIAGIDIPSGTQRWAGANISFEATPDNGQVVKQWTVNGVVVDDWELKNEYSIILTENIHVTVEFKGVVYDVEYDDTYLKDAYSTPTPTP